MSKSFKAALLSGLVFPGIGQLSLKRYMRGFLIIFLVLIAVFGIIGMATYTAYMILQEELRYGMVAFERLSELAHKYSHGDNAYYYACFFVIVFCWVYSIIDALIFSDKKIDKVKPSSPPDSQA